MKIDPKYAFLLAFFLIWASCPFQNLSIWPKHTLFSNFTRFCTPKRCTRVHCFVLKNNPNYVNFFTRMISNFRYKWPPRNAPVQKPHIGSVSVNCWGGEANSGVAGGSVPWCWYYMYKNIVFNSPIKKKKTTIDLNHNLHQRQCDYSLKSSDPG